MTKTVALPAPETKLDVLRGALPLHVDTMLIRLADCSIPREIPVLAATRLRPSARVWCHVHGQPHFVADL